MKTVSILVGNSDDRLSQANWSSYLSDVGFGVDLYCQNIHFFGGSSFASRWQNTCWVGESTEEMIDRLRDYLKEVKVKYRQDSIAFVTGQTEFI